MNLNATIPSNFDNLEHNYRDGGCSNKIDTSTNTNSAKFNGEMDSNKFNHSNSINIYRYKFSDQFINELFRFSKIHEYDDRKVFKEEWNKWMEENEDLINIEVRRLKELGYEGDIFDKMFKSARYYFRKKDVQKKEPAKRRVYVGLQKEVLDAMDKHIKSNIGTGILKPSDGFEQFCKENVNLLKDEVAALCKCNITDPDEIRGKIKKTYKNRYFLVISKSS